MVDDSNSKNSLIFNVQDPLGQKKMTDRAKEALPQAPKSKNLAPRPLILAFSGVKSKFETGPPPLFGSLIEIAHEIYA